MKKFPRLLVSSVALMGLIITSTLFVQAQQSSTGELQLKINAGNSCCIYGTSVAFGEKDINFGISEFSGDFLSYHGTTTRGCKDLLGTETGWAMSISMSGDMENENGNKIGSGNVKISYDNTQIVGGDCVPHYSSGIDVSLNKGVQLIEKDGKINENYGKICELGTTNVKLTVVTNTGQAPGNYQGTLVIDLPNFVNSTCNEEVLLEGTFYDSETDGLGYIGDKGSEGVTSNGGKFSYKPGENLIFKVGTVTIGNAVTPAVNGSVFVTDLFGLARTEITDANVIKAATLLQGLDDDNNPENGINISSNISSKFTGNNNVTSLDVSSKLESLNKPIKTAKEVVKHLEDTAVNKLFEDVNVAYSEIQTGLSDEQVMKPLVDAKGNRYVFGYFQGTKDFGSTTLICNGERDVYVAKINSSGDYERAIKGGGSENYHFNDIAVDDEGNIYIVGPFQGTVSFGSNTLTSSGNNNRFVLKINNSGNYERAIIGGSEDSHGGKKIAVDGEGNIYIVGSFRSTVNFGSTTLINSGDRDVYVAKINSSGDYERAIKGGGGHEDELNGIALDGYGNIYIVGDFQYTSTFGTTTLESSGSSDVYVAKINSSGDYERAIKGGGFNYDYSNGIALDGSGNIYIIGYFQYTSTFGTTTLESRRYGDSFLAILDSDLQRKSVRIIEGIGLDLLYFDEQNSLYIGGMYGHPIYIGSNLIYPYGDGEGKSSTILYKMVPRDDHEAILYHTLPQAPQM